jgi:ubiquinol-cytochrome c reductase cytochrome b subunit
LPIGVGIIVGLHVLMVRRRGVVPPFALPEEAAAPSAAAAAPAESGDPS